MANHLEILGTSYPVYTTSTRVKRGSFAKYGDCWNRDKNISPEIPRPFPVARTQIVEPVLLLNLKLCVDVELLRLLDLVCLEC